MSLLDKLKGAVAQKWGSDELKPLSHRHGSKVEVVLPGASFVKSAGEYLTRLSERLREGPQLDVLESIERLDAHVEEYCSYKGDESDNQRLEATKVWALKHNSPQDLVAYSCSSSARLDATMVRHILQKCDSMSKAQSSPALEAMGDRFLSVRGLKTEPSLAFAFMQNTKHLDKEYLCHRSLARNCVEVLNAQPEVGANRTEHVKHQMSEGNPHDLAALVVHRALSYARTTDAAMLTLMAGCLHPDVQSQVQHSAALLAQVDAAAGGAILTLCDAQSKQEVARQAMLSVDAESMGLGR